MSHLTRVVTAISIALSLSTTCIARAADEPADDGTTRPAPRDAAWTIDARAGYASAWSTGVSHLGIGEGLAIGRTWASGFHLELQGLHFQGQEIKAGNDVLVYRSEYASTQLQVGAGYELAFGILRIRPGLQTGLSFIDGHTTVGVLKVRDDLTRWLVGPSMAVLVQLGRFVAGVDGQAFFVPSDVAAPTAGLYAVFGVQL